MLITRIAEEAMKTRYEDNISGRFKYFMNQGRTTKKERERPTTYIRNSLKGFLLNAFENISNIPGMKKRKTCISGNYTSFDREGKSLRHVCMRVIISTNAPERPALQ
jgi:hypothetical protein